MEKSEKQDSLSSNRKGLWDIQHFEILNRYETTILQDFTIIFGQMAWELW